MIGIDLGSNTLRICQFDDMANKISSDEIIVGSARGLKPGGKLSEVAMENITSALLKFEKKYKLNSTNVHAVATEAFRLASNSKEFFEEIYAKFGLKFLIIDAIKEAQLTKLAIDERLKYLGINTQNTLYIDMGGASCEISFAKSSRSFKFGIVRFAQECEYGADLMQKNAKFVIKEAREYLLGFKFDKLALTSGIPTTIAALKLGIDYINYDASKINGKLIVQEDFIHTFMSVKNMNTKRAAQALGENRRDLVLGGCALFGELLRDINSPFIVIDDGLREGVVLEKFMNLQV